MKSDEEDDEPSKAKGGDEDFLLYDRTNDTYYPKFSAILKMFSKEYNIDQEKEYKI